MAKIKRQTGKMLIQDMDLKIGEHFKVGRYTMVYAGNAGKWDKIVPIKVWKREHK